MCGDGTGPSPSAALCAVDLPQFAITAMVHCPVMEEYNSPQLCPSDITFPTSTPTGRRCACQAHPWTAVRLSPLAARRLLLLVSVLAVGLLLAAIAPPVRSQTPTPTPAAPPTQPTPVVPAPVPILPQTGASSAPAPFPTVEPGLIGNGHAADRRLLRLTAGNGRHRQGADPALPRRNALPDRRLCAGAGERRRRRQPGGRRLPGRQPDRGQQAGANRPERLRARLDDRTRAGADDRQRNLPGPDSDRADGHCTTNLTVQVFAGSTARRSRSRRRVGDLIQVRSAAAGAADAGGHDDRLQPDDAGGVAGSAGRRPRPPS